MPRRITLDEAEGTFTSQSPSPGPARREGPQTGGQGQQRLTLEEAESTFQDQGRSLWGRTRDLVTGEDRGRGTLPELSTLSDVAPDEMGDLRTAAGFFTTPDLEARKDILRKNVPGVSFGADEHGNTVVSLPDGREAFLNAPGLSVQDFTDLGSEIVKFLPAAKLAGAATTIPRRFALGAMGGGATSVGEDVTAAPQGSEQGIDVGRAGLTGLVGGAAEIAAPLVSGVTRFFSRRSRPSEPNVPLTRGQRTGDPRQLGREDRLRARTDEAGQLIRDFDRRQSDRLRQLVDEGQDALARSGRAPLISGEAEAGRLVSEEIGEDSARLALEIDEAFEEAGQRGATVLEDGVNLLGNMRGRLANRRIRLNPNLHPATVEALDVLDALKPQDGVTSRTLENLNDARMEIGNLIDSAKSRGDRFGVTTIKKEMDNFIDEIFEKGLFDGDEEALSLLRGANKLRAEFGRRFQARDSRSKSGRRITDKPGRVVEMIVDGNPTDEQVVNSVFGASQLFSNKAAANVVERLRGAVDNPERLNATLKQLAFRRLVRPALRDGGFMPNRFARSFNDALSDNESLMKTIFSPDELRALRGFRDESLRTVSTNGVMNTTEFSDKLTRTIGRLGTVIGLQRGGIGMGAMGGSFGRGVGQAIGRRIARGQARQAISPVDLLPGRPNNAVISAMVSGGRTAAEQQGQGEAQPPQQNGNAGQDRRGQGASGG